MTPEQELQNEVENILLDFANLYNEVSTSDLHEIATVEAKKIIKLVK